MAQGSQSEGERVGVAVAQGEGAEVDPLAEHALTLSTAAQVTSFLRDQLRRILPEAAD